MWRTVVSKGFFGQKLAGRATQKLGDFVEVLNIVFRFEFRTFDLSDESARDADPVGQHRLRHFLCLTFPADRINDI